jgi:XTP/dITP diphosphohydrolase
MTLNLKGKVIFFATGNSHKFNEARVVLASHGLATGMLRLKGIEIQSDNLAEIAATSVVGAYRQCHLPVIVEDAGLFIDALKGFPGPYAAHAYKTLGNHGILKLMNNMLDRHAVFKSAIVYCDSAGSAVTCFEGEAEGKITQTQRKANAQTAFGFDPIFQPDGSSRTFGEMELAEKNQFSHRAKALNKFAEWYKASL